MKAKKSYKNGGKTKVTGAKTSKYTSKEKKMRDKGARTSSIGPNVGAGAYDVARKDKDLKKKIGTAQNPSAYVGLERGQLWRHLYHPNEKEDGKIFEDKRRPQEGTEDEERRSNQEGCRSRKSSKRKTPQES